MAASVGGRGPVARREGFGGKGVVEVRSGAVAPEGLRREAVIATGTRVGRYDGWFRLGRLVGGGKGVDEFDVEGLDGAERAGVGLPMQVPQRKAGDQAGGDEFVHIVGVKILDCDGACIPFISSWRSRGGGRDSLATCHFGRREGLFHGEQQSNCYGPRSMTGRGGVPIGAQQVNGKLALVDSVLVGNECAVRPCTVSVVRVPYSVSAVTLR